MTRIFVKKDAEFSYLLDGLGDLRPDAFAGEERGAYGLPGRRRRRSSSPRKKGPLPQQPPSAVATPPCDCARTTAAACVCGAHVPLMTVIQRGGANCSQPSFFLRYVFNFFYSMVQINYELVILYLLV